MSDRKHRMVGDYSIIQAIHVGDREVVLGENPEDTSGQRYMCAFCQPNELFAGYSEVQASDNYPQIVKIFGERVAAQAEKTSLELEKPTGIPKEPIGGADCTIISGDDDLNGKVIVIKAEVLRREYHRPTHQLKLCVGGFGASPHSRGTAVFCKDLYSGQTSRFERTDILGTMEEEALPVWAKSKLNDIQREQSGKKDRGYER